MILNKSLVRLTTVHYQSAVSMISFTQVLTEQWSDTIPCWNVQLQVWITSHDIPFQQEWWPVSWQGMLEWGPGGQQWGWTDDQAANSRVVGLIEQPTVQLECLPFDWWYEAWVIHVTNSTCSADVWHMAHLLCFTIWKFGCPSTMAPTIVSCTLSNSFPLYRGYRLNTNH